MRIVNLWLPLIFIAISNSGPVDTVWGKIEYHLSPEYLKNAEQKRLENLVLPAPTFTVNESSYHSLEDSLAREIKDTVDLGVSDFKRIGKTDLNVDGSKKTYKFGEDYSEHIWPTRSGFIYMKQKVSGEHILDSVQIINQEGGNCFSVADSSFLPTSGSMSLKGKLILSGDRRQKGNPNITYPEAILFDSLGQKKGVLSYQGTGMEISSSGEYAITTGHSDDPDGGGSLFQVFRLGGKIEEVPINLPHPVRLFAAAFLEGNRILLVDIGSKTAIILDPSKGPNPINSIQIVNSSGLPFKFNPLIVQAKKSEEGDRIYFLAIDPTYASPFHANTIITVNSDLELKYFSEGNPITSFAIVDSIVTIHQWTRGWNPQKSSQPDHFELTILNQGLTKVLGRNRHAGNYIKNASRINEKVYIEFDSDRAGSIVWSAGGSFSRIRMKESILYAGKKMFLITKNKNSGEIHLKLGVTK